MPETAVAPAPTAVSSPAPVSAPAPAPTPAAAPAAAAPAPVSAPVTHEGKPTTALDPRKYESNESYAAALLNEQLGGVPAVEDEPEVAPVEVPAAAETVPPPDEVPTPEVIDEPEFDLSPPAILTPESLTKMVTDNPEFGKLIEADPALKGQLYKTAREAAELKPFKDIFPDLESAKGAAVSQRTLNEVDQAFIGSGTREGTQALLARMMEMSFERDDDGNVLEVDGKPVPGQHFFSAIDHIVAMDLEHRKADIQGRLDANQYHLGAKTVEERDAAIARDLDRLAFLDEQLGDVIEAPAEEMPAHLKQKAAALDQREQKLNKQQHDEKVQKASAFEKSVVVEAQTRVSTSIDRVIAQVKKGSAISPYLERVLRMTIGDALIKKIKEDTALTGRTLELQRLPPNDNSRKRRVAEVDRAIQMYLPDIALEQCREASVNVITSSKEKAAKVAGQIDHTNKTEPKGSTGPARGVGKGPMTTEAADKQAMAEWKIKNPNKPFDRQAQMDIIPRILELSMAT